MTTYHVTPDGPRPCRDHTGRCPYAKAGEPHFGDQGEARVHYEAIMEEKFGGHRISKLENTRQKAYRATDQAKGYAYEKVDNAREKFAAGRVRVAREARIMKNDALYIKAAVAYKASQKLEPMKEKASRSAARATEVTRNVAAQTHETARARSQDAATKVRAKSATVGGKVKATARVAKRVASLVGRDIANGARRVDSRFKITERAKSAFTKVSVPTSRYARSRVSMIRRIASEEFHPEQTKKTCETQYCSKPEEKTRAQQVMYSRRSDFFRGA